jgi:serine/threonine-protein kinase
MQKISVAGGPPLVICHTADISGASWGPDEQIVFSAARRLYKVSASGGEPTVLAEPDSKKGESDYNWPDFLPGGNAIFFCIHRSGAAADDAQIVVQSLETGTRQVVVEGGTAPRYVPTGHLVYVRAGTLLAVPFDLARKSIRGAPVPIIEGIMHGLAGSGIGSGSAQFSFSNLGWFVYLPGGANIPVNRLAWVDRSGLAQPLPLPPGVYTLPRISPDGRSVAVQLTSSADSGASARSDIWIYDLSREALTRFTSEGYDGWPIWTPDGKRVTFVSTKRGPANIFWKQADGSGLEEQLTTSEHQQQPRSWSPDGQNLVFSDVDPTTSRDLWILPFHGDRKPRPLLRTPDDENNGAVSPDGHWLAYVSNHSSRQEIYMQPFPGPGARLQISTEGGTEPVWARNGKELFYMNGDKLMVVEVKTQPAIEAGKPHMLFEDARFVIISSTPNYDVSPDGRRFLMVQTEEPQSRPEVNVILNWFDELKRKAPPTR